MKTTQEELKKISTPIAIIVAGLLIMIGVMVSGYVKNNTGADKNSISAKLGISKEKIVACIEKTDAEKLFNKINTSVQSALSGLEKEDMVGTPYTIILGSNGSKAQARGALPKEELQKIISQVAEGKVDKEYEYKGSVVPTEEGDHIKGNPNAPIKLIEYSDYDCPFCKKHHSTLTNITEESNGQIAWVFRHWPIHESAVPKIITSECVNDIKGNDAFWKFSELVFEMLDTGEKPSVMEGL